MKIKNFGVSAGMKVSKNFNSVDSNISLLVELEESDKISESYDKLSAIIHTLVDKEILKGLTNLEKCQNTNNTNNME